MAAVAIVAAAPSASPGVLSPAQYGDPAWSRDGSQIAFVGGAGAGDLFVMNADGTHVRQLTSSSPYPSINYRAREPTWSPDGRRIAFAYGYYGISVIDADGTHLHRILEAGDQPSWSPGGRRIAYVLGDQSTGDSIWVTTPEGSRVRRIAEPDEVHSYDGPAWSRDGERLAFSAGRAPNTYRVRTYLGIISDFGGRVARRLRGADPTEPEWSPNRRKIVFSNKGDISVLTLRTNKVRWLHAGLYPRWSPDGRLIAFVCDGQICVMNAGGSHARRLTHG